jgi:hypothetical protein
VLAKDSKLAVFFVWGAHFIDKQLLFFRLWRREGAVQTVNSSQNTVFHAATIDFIHYFATQIVKDDCCTVIVVRCKLLICSVDCFAVDHLINKKYSCFLQLLKSEGSQTSHPLLSMCWCCHSQTCFILLIKYLIAPLITSLNFINDLSHTFL